MLVRPAHRERSILVLHADKPLAVHNHPHPSGSASNHAHSELLGIALGARPLKHALAVQRTKAIKDLRRHAEEPGQEEQEGVAAEVVERALGVCAGLEDVVDPIEGRAQLVAAAVHVEEGEGVDADDGVDARAGRVEVGLDNAVLVDVGQHLVHHAHLGVQADVGGDSEADGGGVDVAGEGVRCEDGVACRRIGACSDHGIENAYQ